MRQLLIWGPILGLGMLIGYALTIRFGQHPPAAKGMDTATQETSVAKPGPRSNELRTRVASVESELSAMRARLEGIEGAPAPEPSAAPESPPEVTGPEQLARLKQEWRAQM